MENTEILKSVACEIQYRILVHLNTCTLQLQLKSISMKKKHYNFNVKLIKRILKGNTWNITFSVWINKARIVVIKHSKFISFRLKVSVLFYACNHICMNNFCLKCHTVKWVGNTYTCLKHEAMWELRSCALNVIDGIIRRRGAVRWGAVRWSSVALRRSVSVLVVEADARIQITATKLANRFALRLRWSWTRVRVSLM